MGVLIGNKVGVRDGELGTRDGEEIGTEIGARLGAIGVGTLEGVTTGAEIGSRVGDTSGPTPPVSLMKASLPSMLITSRVTRVLPMYHE